MRVTPKTLHEHDDKSILSEVTALKDRTRDRKAARKIARNKETITTLVEAVRSKPNFTKMVEYSLECLRNLAVDEASVEEMLDEGVVELVHTVLKLNPYNERIHTMANALLQQFCINDTLAASVGARMSVCLSTTGSQHPHRLR
jgi:ASC-1-like (ASCH) protein